MDDGWDQNVASAAAFPLPFRVLFLICLGILGWATNLHGLQYLGLSATAVLDIRIHDTAISLARAPLPTNRSPGFTRPPYSISLYGPVYRLFGSCTLWCFVMWCIYRYATHQNLPLVDAFKYLPAVAALGVLIGVFCPLNVLESAYRDAFLMAIRRCVAPVLNHRVFLCDVILADIFASYAKVFGDLWLSLCMLLPDGSLLVLPPQIGWSRWIAPGLMSIPYLIRFRQCMVEYTAPSNKSRRPLYNALKYASSFPVIYLSTAQRTVDLTLAAQKRDGQETWTSEHHIFRLWLLCALVNSLYSFWWDITNDWGLDLLLPNRMKEGRGAGFQPPRPLMLSKIHQKSGPVDSVSGSAHRNEERAPMMHRAEPTSHHPFGLRSSLLFPLHYYPFIIVANLVLRLTWSVKLSPHLHSHSEGSLVIFWTEVAEVLRRWMWVFLRVEWEIVKESGQMKIRRSGGSVEDEIIIVPMSS